MIHVILYGIAGLGAVCYILDWLFSSFDGPRAPPRAKSRIPLIGHAIGVVKSGNAYFTKLGAQQPTEVYTVGILHYKVYIVTSRRLIPLVQRLSKSLSFTPFLQFAAKALANCSKETVDLHGNLDFTHEFGQAMKEAMFPGPYLDYQTLQATNCLKAMFEEQISQSLPDRSVRLGLHKWVMHVISIAATTGVYGESNPLLDREMEEAFWTWSEGMPAILAGLGILVPKAVKARELLVDAFNSYLRGDLSDAAQITKERIRVMREWGMPEDDIARAQASFYVALLPNTVPAVFWTIFNIFSRPELLHRIRTELTEHAVTRHQRDMEEALVEMDVAAVRTKCSVLLSAFQETQRTLGCQVSLRKVQEDTTLDSFHLKKGNYLLLQSQSIHFSKDIWGDNPTEFNPDRFFKKDNSPLGSSMPSNSFLAWGAAPHLCPARQFASTEILVLVSLLILRVDFKPVDGTWRLPDLKVGGVSTIPPPKQEVEVEMSVRADGGGKWVLKMGESRSKVPLASG